MSSASFSQQGPTVLVAEAVAKRRAALTFLLAICWIFIALFMSRFATRYLPAGMEALGQECLNAVLLLVGLLLIGSRNVPELRPLSSVGLVRRPTQGGEFTRGLALGWAIALALLLPATLTLHMRSVVTLDAYHLRQLLLGTAIVAINAVSVQLVLTGLAFRSLTRAMSPGVAAAILAGVIAVLTMYSRQGDTGGAIFTAVGSLLFSIAALRTRAIWLPIGLQIGWALTLSVIFGTSSFFWPPVNGPIQTFLNGPRLLTGNGLGPEASLFAFLVLIVALFVLRRITRDYAWNYAHDPIVGAGFPMDVPPPAEHVRMEQQAAPPSLVQIHGIDIPARPPE